MYYMESLINYYITALYLGMDVNYGKSVEHPLLVLIQPNSAPIYIYTYIDNFTTMNTFPFLFPL
jgi:uncharacterized protein YyaL (SSP411 family)